MQIKTIQKVIKKKLQEWLDSIKDDGLRKNIKDNLLLSGGAITSMLLKEDVNDYDIYIKDMNVLIDLVRYYTKPYQDITILDGRDIANLRKGLEDDYNIEIDGIHNSFTVAVNSLKEDQVKLFFNTVKGGMRVNENKEDLNYDPVFFSPNAISLSNDIQIVIRFHGDDVAIHKTFDFIHATNYFTFEKGLVTNKEALESIITKQLSYQGSLYPLTSIIRMKKFIKRNWNVSAGEILKIMFQISELDLQNPNVLDDQLIGVDVAYFDTLISILRGREDKVLTSAYLNRIIDKVFNTDEE